MNRWEIEQKAMVGRCEEMRGPVVVSGQIVCPKPRRVGFLGGNIAMSLRWQQISQQSEINDAKAGAELLDLIFMGKEGHGEDESESPGEIATSPPFFCGTPPTRASNPLAQDSQFGDDTLSPLSTLQIAYPSPSASPSPIKSGCVRMKFGLKSPTIRVEGFDFDCQSSSVTAMA